MKNVIRIYFYNNIAYMHYNNYEQAQGKQAHSSIRFRAIQFNLIVLNLNKTLPLKTVNQ